MKIGRLAKLARVLKNYIDYTGSIADKNEKEGNRHEDKEMRESGRKDIRG